jgi:hypothetical protein
MIKVYNFESLGHANHGWLDARHHFSFASYRNPERLNFGSLRVINDDTILPGRGFATHPHDNMEIITYVRQGAITHTDSMGNIGRTESGDVQVMSAGTGVLHSEENREDIETKLYQIWITPNEHNVAPRWKAKQFPKDFAQEKLSVLASGQAQHANQGALFIHQDAAIFGGKLKSGTSITQPIKHKAYVLASYGAFELNGSTLNAGDGAEASDVTELHIRAANDSEILIIDVP